MLRAGVGDPHDRFEPQRTKRKQRGEDRAAPESVGQTAKNQKHQNRIENVEPAEGFVTPWAKMPDARFFIWEYTGYPKEDEAHDAERMAEGWDLMRRVSAARLNMTGWMNDLMQHSEKLYDDGTIAVFRR